MTVSPYRSVLSTAQQKLNAAINQIRSAIPHPGEAGMLIEQQFRFQLEEVLPEKVGVSHGFVVDSHGGLSKQMDIILYDRLNTPRIFASDGTQMFPVESTYACAEIKTKLDTSNLKDSFEKCASYKNLSREAYFEPTGKLITQTYRLFGSENPHWQSIFFCIAFESINSVSLQAQYNEIVKSENLQVHEKIDTIIALRATDGRNVLINVSGGLENNIPAPGSIDLLPSPGSKLCSYPAKEPWSLFIMLLLVYMTQAPTEPVKMLSYGGDEPY